MFLLVLLANVNENGKETSYAYDASAMQRYYTGVTYYDSISARTIQTYTSERFRDVYVPPDFSSMYKAGSKEFKNAVSYADFKESYRTGLNTGNWSEYDGYTDWMYDSGGSVSIPGSGGNFNLDNISGGSSIGGFETSDMPKAPAGGGGSIGLASYIFYTPGQGTDSGLTSDEIAEIYRKDLVKTWGTDCYLVQITNAAQFKEKWEIISGRDVNTVMILSFHGLASGSGTGYMAIGDMNSGDRIYAKKDGEMRSQDISVDSLASVTMKQLVINVCNTGNPDLYNIAYGFKIKNNVTSFITAWDGGTVFNKQQNQYVRGGGDYVEDLPWQAFGDHWYLVKKYQHTWWTWVKKDAEGNPVRERKGIRYI